MKALRGATISAAEVELVTTALKKYADDLKQYRSWLQTREGKTLPGNEVAAEEVFKEMDGYYKLALRLYRECCTPGVPGTFNDQQEQPR